MLKYKDFIFEKKLEFFIEFINEDLKYISDNEVEWDNVYDDEIPNKYKNYINNILSKSKTFIKKNINNKEKFVKFVNSLINKITHSIKDMSLKKTILYTIISSLILISNLSFNEFDISEDNLKKNSELIEIVNNVNDKEKNDKTTQFETQKSLKDFLKDLSFKESSGNWKSINKYGYIGLYQFGKSALKDAGYDHINHVKFKKNPDIFPPKEQHKAVVNLLKKNKHYLRNYLHYDGEIINGIKITESGILAASHLVGNKSVKKFLKSNGKIDIADKNGTKCSDYLKKFSGYELNI